VLQSWQVNLLAVCSSQKLIQMNTFVITFLSALHPPFFFSSNCLANGDECHLSFVCVAMKNLRPNDDEQSALLGKE